MNVYTSVIIPVYNIEKYIEKNITSLLAIKNNNVEFIFVNDGSTDKSGEILQEYAKKDSRIRVIEQKNGGLSAARNTGIKTAKGEWILFVDGDDWIEPQLTEKLLREADNENDIIWGCYEIVDEKGEKKRAVCLKDGNIGEIKDGVRWMILDRVMYVPWIYLYKSELLKKNQILFPKGLLHEDMDFLPKVFYFAKRVKYVAIPFYKYVNRVGSISTTKNIKRSQDIIKIAMNIEKFEKKYVKEKKYQTWMKKYRGELCCEAIHIAILDGISLQKIFDENPVLRSQLVRYLKESPSIKNKIAGNIMLYKLYWLYRNMYIIYDRLRKKRKL